MAANGRTITGMAPAVLLSFVLATALLPAKAEAVFQQASGAGNIVSIEAEHFDDNTPQGSHAWVAVANPPSGFSGTGMLIAEPNLEINNDNNFLTASPRLDYQVNFVTTGLHYIRVRGIGATGTDDSVHVGLNGQAVSTADDLHMATSSSYAWSAVNRYVNIPSPGVYTVNVWMREDGTQLDKIVLTTDSGLSLSGQGPAESSQTSGGNRDPVARNDAFSVAANSTGNSLAVLADNGSGADSDPDGDTLRVISAGGTNRDGSVSVNGSGTAVLYTPASSFSGVETFTYTISDGKGGSASATVTVTVNAPSGGGGGGGGGTGGGGVFQQGTDAGNIVSIEAEHYAANTPRGSFTWASVSNPPSGYSGDGMLVASPNLGTNNDNNFLTASPRLDYQVNFVTAGVHYIRVRGIGATGTDDSVHVGLNGAAVNSADDLHMTTSSSYAWSTVNRSLNIPSPGVYTVNVWMREDGAQLDKIVLTTNASLALSGQGPAESVREGGCAVYPSVALASPTSGHVQKSSTLTVQTLTCLDPTQHSGWGVRFVLDGGGGRSGAVTYSYTAPYTAVFPGLAAGEHTLSVAIVDGSGNPVSGTQTQAQANPVGIGDYYVAIGDSITHGDFDDVAADDTSADGRDAGGGYEPVLNDLLTAALGYPHTVKNEGVGGITSAGGLSNLPGVLGNHPFALRYLVKYGMNDARPWLPVPSGLGLSPSSPGYPGTFKDNMQRIINLINASGRRAILAKINIALGDGANSAQYLDPETGARTLLIKEYNQVIDELVSVPGNNVTVAPPDFYAYFRLHADTEYADNIHPNGVGYQSMAELWCQALQPSASCTVVP